jgi:hypothetical protein
MRNCLRGSVGAHPTYFQLLTREQAVELCTLSLSSYMSRPAFVRIARRVAIYNRPL